MTEPITPEELAGLMRQNAGIQVEPTDLADRPDTSFEEYGLDSLGLLGIVAALENRHGITMPVDAEKCPTPGAFLDLVNSSLTKSGA
ncbi:acyl carrier protein [Streptomyces clavuligerus]|uniref:Acyl carrier protein n=1 Tax=Streptomyces clavuligerus TaxID=1901 RepID=E2PW00_STRCL|nr:acyl carrier protein [Streptomyces clavuligerus]ANW17509.1 curamycin polyketide synthase [Streptomyces clavuligerus]AXU12054.1 acyl carrier protein [Streptomyces clavuligerus]EFG09990.1 acyl carrier protein [Streptomyces clavuligerus]MBY6301915.1 acyl carrier protein [Streptomyces clavuligerus]QCS04835.1 acyl carrier protein [Streptomyces clavuligerus]